MMQKLLLTLGALTVMPLSLHADDATTQQANEFIAEHVRVIRPLEVAANKAWWDATVTGKPEAFEKKEAAENKVDQALSNADTFKKLKALHTAKSKIDNEITARTIDVLYLQYLAKQVDPKLLAKITAKANAVEQKFNVYRAKVGGKEMTDSEVRNILKTSKESKLRQEAWESSKGVGHEVEADLKELVKLRNQMATELGFKNYHVLMLYLNEQDANALMKLFDELDTLTREPFMTAKKEIDTRLATMYSIGVAELRPWHYHDPFFQEPPSVFDVSLDEPYAAVDIPAVCAKFYKGIGLPVDDVLARSSLYEQKGKSPHAFCTDIDKEGDVRILTNIVPNEYWMGTTLHELGHSVYSSKNIPQSLPYPIRDASHILTTEGVAMQFERFSKSRAWMEKMGIAIKDGDAFQKAAKQAQRNQLLIFSRWCQVMLRFEKSMYENPDQDLNKLWWDLVERYQLVKRPDNRNMPDYGSKIHIVSAPVYYHNYMMGQLFASQVHHTIAKELYNGADPNTVLYIDDKKVGDFMKAKVFEPGRRLSWDGLTKFATGELLNARSFAEDFKQK